MPPLAHQLQAFLTIPPFASLKSSTTRQLALFAPIEKAHRDGYKLIAGVDEAGAGPLAGPVVACAVLLHPLIPTPALPFLNDSKRLSASRRAKLSHVLLHHPAFIVAFAQSTHHEIDRINILQARIKAMSRAVVALPVMPQLLFVDGNRPLHHIAHLHSVEQRPVVKGDANIAVVAMASILAKEYRDQHMRQMDLRFPAYGFAKHVGYPTKMHLQRLKEVGPCDIHRKSFRPVRDAELLFKPHHQSPP